MSGSIAQVGQERSLGDLKALCAARKKRAADYKGESDPASSAAALNNLTRRAGSGSFKWLWAEIEMAMP